MVGIDGIQDHHPKNAAHNLAPIGPQAAVQHQQDPQQDVQPVPIVHTRMNLFHYYSVSSLYVRNSQKTKKLKTKTRSESLQNLIIIWIQSPIQTLDLNVHLSL